MKLKDKIAVVTGGGQGLGEGIAKTLAREGCHLSICDINQERAQKVAREINENNKTTAISVKTDVSDGKQVQRLFSETLRTFGTVDILINNAGINLVAHITELTEEMWDKTMAVNLRGVFLCSKETSKIMIPKKKGKIINISSKSGKQGGVWLSAYCTSKFGIIGFTQSLALDLAPYGINVNTVCPGVIFTPRWDKLDEEYAKKPVVSNKNFSKLEQRQLMARIPESLKSSGT